MLKRLFATSQRALPYFAGAGPQPRWFERLAMRPVLTFLRSLHGVKLIFPDGSTEVCGDSSTDSLIEMRFRNYRMFWRVVCDGTIGLGESYVDGDWETSDLTSLLRLCLERMDHTTENKVHLIRPLRFLQRVAHWWRRNSLTGSRANIQFHYDLSNEFFEAFLDRSMTYSSALYLSPTDSLEIAQRNKLRTVIEKARIAKGDHVLEIGSGWGSFAFLAAKERDCKVTSLTLSEEQLRYYNERRHREGVGEQVEAKLCDYRNVEGVFDRIVSIEMMEAVGYEYLGTFFKKCEQVLKPGGVVVLQVITMLDQWYDEYCKRQDWIQKYIFPGSHLPSLTRLSEVISRETNFVIEDLQNIAPHYARTLNEWRRRFDAALPRIRAMGFDARFERIWRYYLSACEAEFGSRLLNVVQIVLTRPNNPELLKADEAFFDTPVMANVA